MRDCATKLVKEEIFCTLKEAQVLIRASRRQDRGTALTSTLHWFETELLTH